MKINLSVEQKMLTNPDLHTVLIRALWELSQPEIVERFCLHEACHLHYFEPIRAIMGPDAPKFETLGPTILYNERRKCFQFVPAMVKTPFVKSRLQYSDEVLTHLANGTVAGGVFLQELEHCEEGGDSEDTGEFYNHFVRARQQLVEPIHKEERMLNEAREKVTKELLENPLIVLIIRKMAKELAEKHFSL